MSVYVINQQMIPATELIATMTGASVLIGELVAPPVKIVFDNLSNVAVVISTSLDGGATKTQWKTFSAGTAVTLDNDLYSFPKGMRFYGVGASGDFSVAYTYIKLP